MWTEQASGLASAPPSYSALLTSGRDTGILDVSAFTSVSLWVNFSSTAGGNGALQLSYVEPKSGFTVDGPWMSVLRRSGDTAADSMTLYLLPVIAPGLRIKNTGGLSAIVSVVGSPTLSVPAYRIVGEETGYHDRLVSPTVTARNVEYFLAAAGTTSNHTRFNGKAAVTLLAPTTGSNLRGEYRAHYVGPLGQPVIETFSIPAGVNVVSTVWDHPRVPVRWSWRTVDYPAGTPFTGGFTVYADVRAAS